MMIDYADVVSSLLVTMGLAFIISLSLRSLARFSSLRYDVVLGSMFGLAAIMSMVFGGFVMGPGLIGDMRNVLVVSSGIFAGPIGALVATVLTALFRVMLEGNPAGGVIGIVGAGFAGFLFGRAWKGRLAELSWMKFLSVGLAITGVNILVPLIAVPAGWLDFETFLELSAISLPVMIFAYTAGTLTIGVTLRTVLAGIKAERDVMAAKLDAEKASRAKSEFLASMSHELRTPMNAVLGFGQMLELDPDKRLSAKQSGYVANILDGGNHLLDLINEVLDLSRIEANQVDFKIEQVSVRGAVQECLDLITLDVSGKQSIVIHNNTKSGPDVSVQADTRRMRQILLNILSNAVKYSEDYGNVTVESSVTGDGFCRIAVTDTGIGIAEEERGGIFQIFHRLDSGSDTTREGNGIGLAVTKMLVEQMSGRVGFDSELGVGSTFWFELPLVTPRNGA